MISGKSPAFRIAARLVIGISFCGLLGLPLCGCGVLDAVKERALDLTDVLDVKFACPYSLGIGAKVEVTDYLGAGIGACTLLEGEEWFGRRYMPSTGSLNHLVIWGSEESEIGPTLYGFGISQQPKRPLPVVSRFRIGGEVLLPAITLGLYVNLGEIVDLLAGFAGFDPAEDHGVPKGCRLEPHIVIKRCEADLEGDNPFFRSKAAYELGKLGSLYAVEILIHALDDETDFVRVEAEKSLGRLTGQDFGPDPEQWKAWWTEINGEN